MTVEGELQDAGPRKVKLIAECIYIRRDQSQILHDKRQAAQLTLDCVKKIGARTGNPLSRLCSRRAGGHVPGGGEPAEMLADSPFEWLRDLTQRSNRSRVSMADDSVAIEAAPRTEPASLAKRRRGDGGP